MKRHIASLLVLAAAVTLGSMVRADVKTQEKSQIKFEGLMGGLVNMMGGSKENVSTTAVKGARLSRMSDVSGEIIDLTQEMVYRIDVKKKEYTAVSFEELRRQWKDAQDKAAKQADQAKSQEKGQPTSGKEMEFEVDVKNTGQTKSIAGYPAREMIVTITGHEKGKTLDEGGGFVMTADTWMGPKIAALDEIRDFQMKYVKAIYGDMMSGVSPEQMASMKAMFPQFQQMASRMASEGVKMDGTPLASTTTFDAVKSPEEMKAAEQQSANKGGGGLGGLITRRVVGGGPPKQRATVMTMSTEMQSIAAAASDADVAIPAGYKKK